MRTLITATVAVALLLGSLAGCSPGTSSYVRTDVDFSFIGTVAVYPFRNLTQDVHAAPRVQSIFLSELLQQDAVRVLEAGQVLDAMVQLRLGPDSEPTPAQMQELGKLTGAVAIFIGTVEEYGLDRTGGDAAYAVTARFTLVETQTGALVWNAQSRADGGSLWRSLFGGSSASLYDVARRVVRDAQETLF